MTEKPLSLPEFVALFSLLTAVTALSIDTMLPALDDIGVSLGAADPKDTQLVISLFVLGMVFGELFAGPLADAWGRKAVILLGLAIYAIGTVLAMLAGSMEMLLFGRIVQGIGAAGPKIASRAAIRDLYEGDAMARIMSFIFMVFILLPMLAPAFGQLIIAVADWRVIFWTFLLVGAVSASWLGFRQPETLALADRIPFAPKALVANGGQVVRHPKVMAYTVSAGFVFGSLLLYLGTAQAIFDDIYAAGPMFALYFAILAIGIGLASFLNGQLVMRFGAQRMSVVALFGLVGLSLLLLAICAVTAGRPPLVVFMSNGFALFFCFGLIFGNINALAMRPLGLLAGLGASLNAAISSLIAVIFAVVIGRQYDETLYPLAIGFLLAGVVSLTLVAGAGRSGAGNIRAIG